MYRKSGAHLSKIYSSTLFSTLPGEGHALWFPEPHSSGEAQIGDVGFIKDGAFVRLLNVDTGNQHYRVDYWPDPFVPAPLTKSTLLPPEMRENAIGPGRYRSRGVQESEVKVSAEGGASVAVGGVTLSFTCNEEHGAILNLKSPAHALTLFDTKQIRNYIWKNYEHWAHYTSETLGLEGIDKIIFVRGWVKTSPDWTVTAFTSHGSKWTASFDAQGGAVATVGVGIEFSNRQTTEGPVVTRFGEDSGGITNKGKGRATMPGENQCMFLKYYSVKTRRFWLSKIEASAGPNRLSEHRDNESDSAVLADAASPEIALEDDSSSDSDWAGPVDALLDYILSFSDAEIAIGCDEDIAALLIGQEWPRDIGLYLRQTQPRVEVDDNKCGTLSLYDAMRKRRQYDYSVRSPEDIEGELSLPDNQTQAGILFDGRVLLGPSQASATTLDWPHTLFKHKDAENGAVTSVTLSPDGSLLAAAWDDITVTVWRMKDGLMVQNLEDQGHVDTVWAIAFSPDNSSLVSGSADATAIMWDVPSGHVIWTFEGHTSDIMSISFSPDGTTVATGSTDCTVKIWSLAEGDLLHNLEGHVSDIMRIAYSPDGNRLASCADSGVFLWDPNNGAHIATLQGHESAIWCMAWSAQSDRLITGSEDNSSRIWDANNGEELVTLQEHTNSVWAVAFSPDGWEVASASYDATVITCDSFTADQHHVFSDAQLSSVVEAVTYSTKGEFIASGSADGNVRVWNAKSGDFVAEFQGHEEKVKSVQFTPDDNSIVSYGEDGTIRVWSVLDAMRLSPPPVAREVSAS